MAENAIQKINPQGPPGTLATLKAFISSPSMIQSLKDVCTSILTPEQVAKQLFLAASRQPKLLECTLPSLCKSIATAAQLGLDCSGTLGSGYLVPYWNGKINGLEAQFIPGFRGLVDLARRSGTILDIQAHVVYKADYFEYRLGTQPVLNHTPDFNAPRSDADIIGAYAVAWMRDAQPHPEFMPRAELDAIKNASKSKTKDGHIIGPWNDYYAEMCKKTVVRRVVKMLPLSVEIAEKIALSDEEIEPSFIPETRPRREMAQINIEEVLGKATEKTTQPGGNAQTALQPKNRARIEEAPKTENAADEAPAAETAAQAEQPKDETPKAPDYDAEVRIAWRQKLNELKGVSPHPDVIESQIDNHCQKWIKMSFTAMIANKPNWLKGFLDQIKGGKIKPERFEFGLDEPGGGDELDVPFTSENPPAEEASEEPKRPGKR